MTTFKIFCHRYPVSGILCQPDWAIDENHSLVKLLHIMPLAENCAKWHKIIVISSIMPQCSFGMMLIINVRVIMRYAVRLTDVFLATYQ